MSSDHFERAKNSTIKNLETLVEFSSIYEQTYPAQGANMHTKNLMGLVNKLKGSVKPSLTSEDFQKLDNFRQFLSKHEKFRTKLEPLSALCIEIAKAAYLQDTLSLDVAETTDNMNKFVSVSEATEEARRAVSITPMGILTVMSVLLLITSRRQTFYHATKRILDNGIKTLKLTGYDIEEICSVESKVGRQTKTGVNYESDVETIRNCIGHVYYDIKRQKNGSYIIKFERHDQGYNYHKEFTDMQLIRFFNDYQLLETLQAFVLNTCLIQGFILRYLMKREGKLT